jgi:hypothetical protein
MVAQVGASQARPFVVGEEVALGVALTDLVDLVSASRSAACGFAARAAGSASTAARSAARDGAVLRCGAGTRRRKTGCRNTPAVVSSVRDLADDLRAYTLPLTAAGPAEAGFGIRCASRLRRYAMSSSRRPEPTFLV